MKIKSISKMEEPQEVYDLACTAPHTYISNGFVSHNCVLFIDEIEKAFGGNHSDSAGSGADMLATILMWLQENKSGVYTIGASNSIANLPPVLVRAGRFSKIWFVDLPGKKAREDILRIHLKARTWDPDEYKIDIVSVAERTNDFSGSELEQVVIDSIRKKALEDITRKTHLQTRHLHMAIDEARSSAHIYPEELLSMRQWASARNISIADSEVESGVEPKIQEKHQDPEGSEIEI